MKKLLLLLSFTVFIIGADIQAPEEGTLKISEGKILDVRCFQNTSRFKIRWSKIPFSTTNEGAILSPRETTCLKALSAIYVKSKVNIVSIQVWKDIP